MSNRVNAPTAATLITSPLECGSLYVAREYAKTRAWGNRPMAAPRLPRSGVPTVGRPVGPTLKRWTPVQLLGFKRPYLARLAELRARLYVTGVVNICDMVRVLITGGSGFLGSTLGNLLSTKYEVFAAYLNSRPPESASPLQFDIRNGE